MAVRPDPRGVGGPDGGARPPGLVVLHRGPGGGPRALRLLGAVARHLLPRRQDRLLGRPDDAHRLRLRDEGGRPAADDPPRLQHVSPPDEPRDRRPGLRAPAVLVRARRGDGPDRDPRHARRAPPRPHDPDALRRAKGDARARGAARPLPQPAARPRRPWPPAGPDAAGLGLRPRDPAQRPDDPRGPGPRGRAVRRAAGSGLPRPGAARRHHDAHLDHGRGRRRARGEPDGPHRRPRDGRAGPGARGPGGDPDGPAGGRGPRAHDPTAHRRPDHGRPAEAPHRRPRGPRPRRPRRSRAVRKRRHDRGARRRATCGPGPPRPISRSSCGPSPSSRATPRRSSPRRRRPREPRHRRGCARSASCATCTRSWRRSRR